MQAFATRLLGTALMASALWACSDDEITDSTSVNGEQEKPQWYYAGGQLGTSYLATSNALEQPTPAVEDGGMYQQFKNGEAIFEKPFMSNPTGTRSGLGPAYIRSSCIHCHPGYSHG